MKYKYGFGVFLEFSGFQSGLRILETNFKLGWESVEIFRTRSTFFHERIKYEISCEMINMKSAIFERFHLIILFSMIDSNLLTI